MSLRILLALGVLTLATCIPQSVDAFDGCGDFWGYYAWNYHRMPLRTGNVPAPPYFSLHPPVYYSGIQYRPYGDSPFAYLPTRSITRDVYLDWQPGAAAAPPLVIENPYYEPEEQQSSTSKGKVITNPYYQAADDGIASTD